MKRLAIITILLCLIFLIHCNRNGTQKTGEIIISPQENVADVEFSKSRGIPFSNIFHGFLFVDDLSVNIYGYNSRKHAKSLALLRYDHNLNLLARKDFFIGQGPGDVGTGLYFTKTGDHILGFDNTQRRINIFDSDLKFEKFINSSGYGNVVFAENGQCFFCISSKRDPDGYTYRLVRVTFPGLEKKEIYKIGTYWLWNKQKKGIIGRVPVLSYFIHKKKLYLLNAAEYRITMFDLEGNVLKKVRVNVEKEKVPVEKEKQWLFEQHGKLGVERCVFVDPVQPVSWAIPLGKGFAVVRRKDYLNDCQGTVEADYFDYNLNLIGKINVPCFVRIFQLYDRLAGSCQYDNGYLYLINEDREKGEYILEKWSVKE